MNFKLATIQPGIPHHVVVTYKPGLLVCYLNGKIASQTSFEKGSFDKWHGSSYSLIFGNEVGGVRPWEGYLDSVAIYGRFIDAQEAAKKFELASARIAQTTKNRANSRQGGNARTKLIRRRWKQSPPIEGPGHQSLSGERSQRLHAREPNRAGGRVGAPRCENPHVVRSCTAR